MVLEMHTELDVDAQIASLKDVLLVQPPFNTVARAQAGFGEEWYMPIAAASGSSAAAFKGAGPNQQCTGLSNPASVPVSPSMLGAAL